MPPKGPPKAALSAIKSMLAAKQAAEEEVRRLEEEERRCRETEEARLLEETRKEEEDRRAKKEKEKMKKDQLKAEGKLVSKAEKERQDRNRLKLQQLLESGVHVPALEQTGSAAEECGKSKKPIYGRKKKQAVNKVDSVTVKKQGESEHPSSEEDDVVDDWEAALEDTVREDMEEMGISKSAEPPAPSAAKSIQVDNSPQDARKEHKELRSPICCILGHVDTGKTKLLDKVRQTNVQEGEAGGITQQIGATYFPQQAIQEKTAHLHVSEEIKVPGLLIIDTPGHESFTNLRSRGSSLCNIAILVVDIMHGLEPQTLESIGLLRQRKTPFLVALNKIDRLYGWTAMPGLSVEECLTKQAVSVQKEFEDRLQKAQLAFSEQGLNAELFYRNQDVRKCVSLVPASAITGDGVGDLIWLTVKLTQSMMQNSLQYLSDLQCTVLEVKVVEGLGTTVDAILSNGVLREGDKIAVCGLNGPIVTTIRSLLTPQPLRELRIKSTYVHNKQVKAALGVKICAPDLEKAVAGSQLLLIGDSKRGGMSEEKARDTVMQDLTEMLESVDKSGKGVFVQASTLGSLEALLSFLKSSQIPVSGVSIGPVYKKDIVRASVMLEQDAKEYACLLAFDVRVDKDAQELADELDVRIFTADIIYHLFDQFTAYMAAIDEQKRKDAAPSAVFPCLLKIVPGCVFNKRSPLVLGVDIIEGQLRQGTPLSVIKDGQPVFLGRVTSIELNHRPLDTVRRGGPSVAIKLEVASYEPSRQFGRHFLESDEIYSRISRQSIDIVKETFRQEMDKEDWALVIKLKKLFNIQ